MKRTLSQKLKKSVSAILAAAISLSLFTAIPVSADIGRTTYNYDGYSVDYNVTNEWDGAQTVELTVSNTGTDSILNWALKYDTEGKISNLWNADLYEQNGDEYVIKNVGWNFEIAPSQSVTYGYTLNGNDLSLPENFEIYSKRVDKAEGYDVQYNITKSWDTGVEGNIVITNISPAPIEAWTLSFDSNFTIDNLWNGRVLENNGTSYTVAAEMWTNPVQPNGSMTIGFVGSKASDVEALLSNFRLTEVVIGEGGIITPDPKLEITANAVYDKESGNISVSWTSNKQDGTFDVLISEDGKNFVSVGIVENSYEFSYIPESDFETLYFKVVQTVDEQTAESNVVIFAKSEEDIAISADASYDKESGKITVSWTSNKENGTFEVFVSEDGENFTSFDTVEDVTKFIYSPNNEFDVLYFKVKQTIGKLSAESNVAIIDYPINWEDTTDTDNDGLPDVYEKYYFETDPTNPDTDGDGLPDGYEVYYLGTDPKKADTDDDGITDGDEDFDEDGLSNLREYELGTDPSNADSDSDGLSDGDEVNKYNTDPLKYDTDNDGISDGDEVTLGLDPASVATDGILDSERTFVQHIGEDYDNFAAINTSDNPYKVSIDITAAGVAANNLSSNKSGYSNAIKNDAILGITPEFTYTDGLKVEDIVINFDIDNSAVENVSGAYTSASGEFVGIKRLNVFKFFEETNMLLPIETFHDVENNRVYTHVDELGTYCLMDMELWLEGLEIEPDDNSDDNVEPMFFSARTAAEEEKNIDVVFILYNSKGLLNSVKAEMKTTSENIFKQAKSENANVRMYFVSFLGKSIEAADGNIYVDSYEEAEQIIDNYGGGVTAALDEKNYALYKALNYTANNYVPQFRENSDRYCFVIDACVYPKVDSGIGAIDTFNKNNVRLCFSYSPNNSNALNYSLLSTGACEEAIIGNGRYNFCDFVIKEIFGEHENEYPIISAVGWKKIKLDSPITETYKTVSDDVKVHPENIERYKNSGMVDTDKDGLLDFQEINFDLYDKKTYEPLIKFDENGNLLELPSALTCNNYADDCYWGELTYVENGWAIFKDSVYYDYVHNIRILPIKSDPTDSDGDKDGISDNIDGEALHSNEYYGILIDYINEGKIKFSDVISDGKVSICTVPITDLDFVIGFEPFECYDEYGDEYDVGLYKKSIINGYFDNWYIVVANNNGSFEPCIAYTTDCQKFIDKNSDPFKIFSKAFDSYVMSKKTIRMGYIEDGFWKAAWDEFTGSVSALLESGVADFGTICDVVDFFTPNFNSKDTAFTKIENYLGSEQSYHAKCVQWYKQFEKEHFDTDSDTFNAAKTIVYSKQMVIDAGITFSGIFVGKSAEAFVIGSISAAPETGGTSLAVAIPACAVGALADAVVTETGVILLASDIQGYNSASKAMRDAQMFDKDSLSYKIRNAGDDILDISETGKGHTLEKHVSQTNEELIRRANKESVAASSYADKSTAIKAVKQDLRENTNKIVEWLSDTSITDNLTIQGNHNFVVGKGVKEGRKTIIYGLSETTTVLTKDSSSELGFIILTSYPKV